MAFKGRTKWCFDCMFMRGRWWSGGKSTDWGVCIGYEHIYRFTVSGGT